MGEKVKSPSLTIPRAILTALALGLVVGHTRLASSAAPLIAVAASILAIDLRGGIGFSSFGVLLCYFIASVAGNHAVPQPTPTNTMATDNADAHIPVEVCCN